MMIQAVLGNPHHPEYGVATIPFPIPRDQHAHCMELLEALEIGDAVKADCKVEKIDSFYTVLKRAEMLTVNVEELNYLAKRLDSFDTGEAAQFQAMAHKLELFELKDLINLTFCCQQATAITDFSDLDAVGRDHYMNLHGGSASVDELNALDDKGTARQLIESGSGTVTPYKTNLSGDYRTLADNLSTSKVYVLDARPAVLGLAANERVTEVMFVFGNVKAGFAQVETPYIYATARSGLANNSGIVNVADVGGLYNGQWIQAVSRWLTTVYTKTTVKLPKTGY